MLNAEELGLADVLSDTDAGDWIRAIATGAGYAVAIVGRDEVETHLGRALEQSEWEWLYESDAWSRPLGPFVDPGRFIDQALADSDAVAKAAADDMADDMADEMASGD